MMFVFSCLLVSGLLCVSHPVAAKCPSAPVSLPNLIYLGLPNNDCIQGTDGSKCDVFLRMAPNSENDSFVDFYMEGNLAGWVAVGFSLDKFMQLTDVVGCQQASNGSLGVANAWNPDDAKHNVIDPSQELMCNYGVKYEDKRIKCHFGRYSGVINQGYDYDLNGTYYLLLGRSDNKADTIGNAFPKHTEIPVPTSARFNVFDYTRNTSNGTASAAKFKTMMKKAHGSLMLISWIMMATSGIFFAMWMKPAFSGGLWFQFHRGLMIAALIVEVAGFICIFVATKDNKIPGLLGFECSKEIVHFVFGILATAGLLLNPVLGLLRPKLESPQRWLFNLSHGSLGSFTLFIALINIAVGLSLFQNPCGSGSNSSYPMYQVYLGWFAFFILAHIIMFGLFTCLALMSRGNERYELAPSLIKPILRRLDSAEYKPLNTGGTDDETDVIGKDAILRKAAFGIYTAVNTISVVILVAMIGSN